MRDIDIRKILLKTFRHQYKNDTDTLIIPELGLCQGDARIDLAVVNGLIQISMGSGLKIESQ